MSDKKVVSMDGEYTHIAINCEYTERLDLENIHRLLHLNKSEVEFVKDLDIRVEYAPDITIKFNESISFGWVMYYLTCLFDKHHCGCFGFMSMSAPKKIIVDDKVIFYAFFDTESG